MAIVFFKWWTPHCISTMSMQVYTVVRCVTTDRVCMVVDCVSLYCPGIITLKPLVVNVVYLQTRYTERAKVNQKQMVLRGLWPRVACLFEKILSYLTIISWTESIQYPFNKSF